LRGKAGQQNACCAQAANALWLLFSALAGFTFTAWFVPASELISGLQQWHFSAGAATSMLLYGGLMYANVD
jgi:hypothetical protein